MNCVGIAWRSAFLAAGALLSQAAGAQDIIPPKQYTVTPGGINISDASLVHSVTDLSMGTLTLERFHRSGLDQPNFPMFGKNFASNLDIYVATFNTSTSGVYRVVVHLGSTASGTYQRSSSTSYIIGLNNDSSRGKLAYSGSKYTYTDSSGTIYTFSATIGYSLPGYQVNGNARKVERIDFPDGRVQTFTYNTSGNLKFVEDSGGYAMVFDYNGANVSAACVFNRGQTYVTSSSTCTGAAMKTSYIYTGTLKTDLLTSATDVLGNTTNYTNTTKGVTCIKPPPGTTCAFTISSQQVADATHAGFRVTQTMADGAVWAVNGRDDSVNPPGNREDLASDSDGAREAVLGDPAGKVTAFTFTKSSPYSMTDALQRSSSFRFDGAGAAPNTGGAEWTGSYLREATYPEGDQYQADYWGPFGQVNEERRVPKPGSGLTTLTKTYTYGSCTASPGTYQNCAKPLSITDPAGKTSNFTYASHGGVLTEMGPAPVANGARPLKVTTWTQRYAYVKNSGGTLVQSAYPTWVKATETVCQTVAGSSPAASCDGSAVQTTTTYEYGATGSAESLLVKGMAVASGGTTLRTCYTYDVYSRKVSETQPLGTGSSCP